MDSTARLVRSDVPYVDLAFQLLPARQHDMQEDSPIPGHIERKMRLIAAGLDFLRFAEDGHHPWVRHVCLERDVRSC